MHVNELIQERNINTGEKVEFKASGDKIEAVYINTTIILMVVRNYDIR